MGPVATDRRQERDCNARGGGWRWGLKQPLEEGQIPELCVPLAWATELWAGQGQTVGPKERRSEVGSEVLSEGDGSEVWGPLYAALCTWDHWASPRGDTSIWQRPSAWVGLWAANLAV